MGRGDAHECRCEPAHPTGEGIVKNSTKKTSPATSVRGACWSLSSASTATMVPIPAAGWRRSAVDELLMAVRGRHPPCCRPLPGRALQHLLPPGTATAPSARRSPSASPPATAAVPSGVVRSRRMRNGGWGRRSRCYVREKKETRRIGGGEEKRERGAGNGEERRRGDWGKTGDEDER